MNVICIVLNNFVNDSRVLKTSLSLIKNGYRTKVVALHQYGLPEHEKYKDLTIHRIKLFSRSWTKHRLVQIFKYFEFTLRLLITYRNQNIFHCNDLSSLPIGVLAKYINKNIKVVYDAHEYETEVFGLYGVEKVVKKIIERFFIKYADRVICVSDSIANEYKRIYKIKIPDVVLNCPKYEDPRIEDLFRSKFSIRRDQFIFLYQGGLCSGRGIEILIDVFAKRCTDEYVLVLLGFGPLKEYIRNVSLESNNIFFHEGVSQTVLHRYTCSADYGIIFYEDNCLNHRFCLPNKIFQYFMAGIPVLSSNLVELKKLVNNKLGVISKNNTFNGFERALDSFHSIDYSFLTKNVKKVSKNYCWENQELILTNIYRNLSV